MLKSTTTSAITSAIKYLSSGTLAENLTIRRKYKATQEGIIKKWWFVVSLELLKEEWSKIATQTGWKLEQAFRYDNSNTVPAQQSIVNEAADPADATVTSIFSNNDSTNDYQVQPQPPIPDSNYSHCPLSKRRGPVYNQITMQCGGRWLSRSCF